MFNSSPLEDFVFYIVAPIQKKKTLYSIIFVPIRGFVFYIRNEEKIYRRSMYRVFVPVRGFCFLYRYKVEEAEINESDCFRPH